MVQVPVHYSTPQFDQFHRAMPASREGPPERWAALQTLIDFGGWLFGIPSAIRAEQPQRDLVLVALLRRALVTAEGLRVLLAQGLEEPAVGLTRTLLDIELAMKLVTQDRTDRTAKKLAAWHYYAAQKHGQRMLDDTTTRASLRAEEAELVRVVQTTKSFANLLRLPVFDEVREEVRRSRHWHGFDRVEDAFRAVGAVSDYTVPYNVASPFVHASNVDHDFTDIRLKPDGGQEIAVRPFVQRDPERVLPLLGTTVLRLHNIITMYVEDRGLEDTIETVVRKMEEACPPIPISGSIRLDAMAGVMATVLEPFGGLEFLKQAETEDPA